MRLRQANTATQASPAMMAPKKAIPPSHTAMMRIGLCR